MPTYRTDLHLGRRVPYRGGCGNGGDVAEGSITPDKLSADTLKMVTREVELSDLDTLGVDGKDDQIATFMGQNGSRYAVMNRGILCGVLELFTDGMDNAVTQVFTTNLVLINGGFNGLSRNDKVFTYYRSYGMFASGSGQVPEGIWRPWKDMGYGDYDGLDNIPTLDGYKLQGEMTHEGADIARYTDVDRLLKKVFPLTVSVTGGGVYKKGTEQIVQVTWAVKEGDTAVQPDAVTVNGEAMDADDTYKVFFGVTQTTTYTVTAIRGGVAANGSTTAKFVNPSYFGVVAASFSPTAGNVSALSETIKDTRTFSASASTANQKVCYAYPASFGALTSIKDASGYEYIGSFTRSTETINGEDYYIYLLTDASSVSNYRLNFN